MFAPVLADSCSSATFWSWDGADLQTSHHEDSPELAVPTACAHD